MTTIKPFMNCLPKIFLLGAITSSLLAPNIQASVLDRIAAVVNDEVILQSEVSELSKAAVEEIPATLSEGEATKRKKEIYKRALDALIDESLIRQQVREHQIQVSPEEVEKRISQLMQDNKLNEKQFAEALKMEGKTVDQLKSELGKQLEKQKLIDLEMQNNPELRGKMMTSEKDVEEYYQANYLSETSNEKVRASHILFLVPPGTSKQDEGKIHDNAQKVLEQIRAGAKFEDMAKEHSEDPSGAQGGDLGWFRRGDMVPEFEKSAFQLKKGELSDLVRTKFGYHIILVTDKAVEGVQSLEKVRNEIRSRLSYERYQQTLREWLDGIRQRSFIEYKL